jgi:UDP-2,3-diacylglucosamine hydrolase
METQAKKIYLASDFHLGAPNYEESLIREKKIVSWLNHIEDQASEIFLVGDVFDFWFEYKRAIPKGFVRLQGKIAALTDKGIPVHIFMGNHDMWMFDYLPKELGIKLHDKPIQRTFFGKDYFIGHGDGLGPGDKGYKILKKILRNRFCQWCFARLHPNFGIWLAEKTSKTSRVHTGATDEKFLGEEKEWLIHFCREELKKKHYDYFVFGHRHLPLEFDLSNNSKYFNLGEWIHYCTYLVIDENGTALKKWE